MKVYENLFNIRNENGDFIPIPALRGKDGKTPVKGVDYFTESDKKEITSETEKKLEESEFASAISADIQKLNNIPPEGTDPVPEGKMWGTTADGADWVDAPNADFSDYVKNTDYATSSKAGVIKIGSGLVMTVKGSLEINQSSHNELKKGMNTKKPIVPEGQHESVYYALAKLAGHDLATAEGETVGVYDDETAKAIRDMLRANVKINGVETEDNNIPIASQGKLGLIAVPGKEYGLYLDSTNNIRFASPTVPEINSRDYNKPLTSRNIDNAVRIALCDGKGAPYTETEQASARDRIDAVARKDYDKMKESYERRIINLEYAARGQLYREDIQEGEDYQKDIQSDIMPYGTLDRIGGKTICFNQMLGDSYPKAVEDEYYEQTMEDKAKTFDVDVLGGKSFVWNQNLKNFDDIFWKINSSATKEDDEITYTPLALNQIAVMSNGVLRVNKGHTYLFIVDCKTAKTTRAIQVNFGRWVYVESLNDGKWHRYGLTTTSEVDSVVNQGIRFSQSVEFGEPVSIKNPMLFDLTAMGIEDISVDDFNAIFPADYYPYSEPTIVNADSKQVMSHSADGEIVKTISTESLVRKYFPSGMKSAGDARDYFDFRTGEAVRCIGSVDLGTLNWIHEPEHLRFRADLINIAQPIEAWGANILTTKYKSVLWNSIDDMFITVLGVAKRIYIKDSIMSETPELFKQSLKGIIAFYELATPIRTSLTEEEKSLLHFIYCEQGGTITFENILDNMHIPVPVTETFQLSEWSQPLDNTHKYSHNGQLVSGASEVNVAEGDYLIDMTRAGCEDANAYVGDFGEKNDGELVSAELTEVVSVGRNLFDISKHTDFHSGKVINSLNGEIVSWGTSWGYIDYIEISPNKSYLYMYDNLNSFADTRGIAIYDKKYNYVGGAYKTKNGAITFDTPSNAKYCRLSVVVDSVNTVQLEEGTVPTTYTPYFSETKPLSDIISKYFPNGMKSAGSVSDYIDIESGEAVQVVGSVDLGTLNWNRGWTDAFYTDSIVNGKPSGSVSINANILCEKYKVGSPTNENIGNANYFVSSTNKRLGVCTGDSNIYPTGTMVYELAEPIHTPLVPEDIEALKTLHVEGGGTLTFAQSDDRFHIPVPNKETFLVKTGGASS